MYIRNIKSEMDHTKRTKPMIKHDPAAWNIYRRLNNNDRSGHQLSPCHRRPVPSRVLPNNLKSIEKCTHYNQLMRVIHDCRLSSPKTLYNRNCRIRAMNPDCSVKRCEPISKSRWHKTAEENFEKNKLSQIPLSSVVVRWQFTRTCPVYNEDSLRSILSEYGNVREVRMISLQSALVIFEDLTSACDVMQCHNVGERRNRLACSWWHRSMSNKSIIVKPDGMHIMTNTFQI